MKTPIHDLDSAPDASKPLLEGSRKAMGRIPGLHAVMAESPALLEGYQRLHQAAMQDTAFTPTERTVVWMTINVFHECHYCVPAHTGIAKAEEIDDEVIDALRDEAPLPDDKLEALRSFTRAVLAGRGRPSPEAVAAFEAAGYGERHALDLVMIVAQKVMSNYVNAMFETPLDAAFEPFRWAPKARRAA
jgi:alkylhydroperoxidase family enzyme